MTNFVIHAKHLQKTFTETVEDVQVFSDINLQVCAGEAVAIIGPSGAGKSTLLQLLGKLDKPTSGSVTLSGQVGFVYQFHHLLPELNALENVMLPVMVHGGSKRKAKQQAAEILERVGLCHRLNHPVAKLSGGEKQRVAIARAIVTSPVCLLADEPTGNLDQKTSEKIFELLFELNQERNMAMVVVTHNQAMAEKFTRILELSEGVLHGKNH